MDKPNVLLLFSGKRKTGKDFLTEKLLKRLGSDRAEIVRISAPIKAFWAKEKNLNLKELLSDGPYKEIYRKEMIVWSENVRAKDNGFFCKEATRNISKPVVIVSDIRRKTDVRWFKENFPESIKIIRIKCDEEIRKKRGWNFETGVDDVESEIDLDDFTDWDLELNNDGSVDAELLLDEIEKKFIS